MGNGDRVKVTVGAAQTEAGPGAQAANSGPLGGQTGRGEAPLCKDLGEWRKGMVGTGGLGRKQGASTLSQEEREVRASRRLSVGGVHDSLRKAFSHTRLFAALRTVTRLLCPGGLSRQEYWSRYQLFLLQGIFPSQDRTCIFYASSIGRRVLLH